MMYWMTTKKIEYNIIYVLLYLVFLYLYIYIYISPLYFLYSTIKIKDNKNYMSRQL